jgi:hypothetical protein
MNKRIQELALQCGAWHQVYDQKRFMINDNFDVEQFAQLVVQECADRVMQSSDRYRKEYFAEKVLGTFQNE